MAIREKKNKLDILIERLDLFMDQQERIIRFLAIIANYANKREESTLDDINKLVFRLDKIRTGITRLRNYGEGNKVLANESVWIIADRDDLILLREKLENILNKIKVNRFYLIESYYLPHNKKTMISPVKKLIIRSNIGDINVIMDFSHKNGKEWFSFKAVMDYITLSEENEYVLCSYDGPLIEWKSDKPLIDDDFYVYPFTFKRNPISHLNEHPIKFNNSSFCSFVQYCIDNQNSGIGDYKFIDDDFKETSEWFLRGAKDKMTKGYFNE